VLHGVKNLWFTAEIFAVCNCNLPNKESLTLQLDCSTQLKMKKQKSKS